MNKGQEYDSNVNVVVNLPTEQLSAINASGASTVKLEGQTVTFAPLKILS